MDLFEIKQLSTADLLDLNHQVVEEIKKRETQSERQKLRQFKVGDRIFFDPEGGRVYGAIIKINQKTVTILDDDKRKWRVSPHLVSKGKKKNERNRGNVVSLFQSKG